MGLDAVLDKDVYLATSEGEKINPLKPKRRKLADLKAVQTKKNAKRKGSRARRKLAQRERGLHARIAKSRQDFQYQLATTWYAVAKRSSLVKNLTSKT